MGKRSNFERVEKDFYRTIDPRAVAALAPHLAPSRRFVEPCAGSGDLMDQLVAMGHICDSAFDIDPKREDIYRGDAFKYHWAGGVDLNITNPPWSRPILHALIDHLSALRPTWLLFDADWAHTLQSKPYMSKCVKIVSVGRLIWIPGTKMQGKDSVCWYLFDANHNGPTEFVGR
jgi:hypothetical protein